MIYSSTSLHPAIPMTNLVETELFGGAIKANYPKNFIDASYVIGCQSKPWLLPTDLDLT
jgi:hypothetical protein